MFDFSKFFCQLVKKGVKDHQFKIASRFFEIKTNVVNFEIILKYIENFQIFFMAPDRLPPS